MLPIKHRNTSSDHIALRNLAHIHVVPALTPPPHRRPLSLQLRQSSSFCSLQGAGTSAGGSDDISTDGLIVFV